MNVCNGRAAQAHGCIHPEEADRATIHGSLARGQARSQNNAFVVARTEHIILASESSRRPLKVTQRGKRALSRRSRARARPLQLARFAQTAPTAAASLSGSSSSVTETGRSNTLGPALPATMHIASMLDANASKHRARVDADDTRFLSGRAAPPRRMRRRHHGRLP
jgi:hypothetical protein